MSAGAIPAPQIIALQAVPQANETDIIKKNALSASKKPNNRSIQTITTNTYISINSDFKQPHSIFFTADETKPNVSISQSHLSARAGPPIRVKPNSNSTIKYDRPFLVSNGKRTIRAVAISHIDGRESFISSKTYYVEYEPPDTSDDDNGNNSQTEENNISPEVDDGYVETNAPDLRQSMASDNMENFQKVNLRDRKRVNDMWKQSFNYQPPNSAPPMQQQYQQQNTVYANPDFLDFGGISVQDSTAMAQFQGNFVAPPSFSQPMVANSQNLQFPPPNNQGIYEGATIYDEFTKNTNKKKICRNKGTQTVGLFYPGGKRVQAEDQKRLEEQFSKLKNKSQAFLSEISPGKGYWRKQVDHVNQHIRKYATENLEFRSLIADQKFGRIVHSHIDESVDKITLSFTFDLHGISDKPIKGGLNYGTNIDSPELSFGSRQERGISETVNQRKMRTRRESAERQAAALPKNYKRGRSPVDPASEQNPVDRLLISTLKESRNGVTKSGTDLETEIQQLLSEGADPNAVDYEDEQKSALIVALQNPHVPIEIIEQIIVIGANINEQYGKKSITALHVAVSNENKKAVELLLAKGAKTDVADNRERTAYDLAVKINNRGIIRLMSGNLGTSILNSGANSRRGSRPASGRSRKSNRSADFV